MNGARVWWLAGALTAALWVALSAAASHVSALQAGGGSLQASLTMQQFHALGLLLLGCVQKHRASRWLALSGGLMVAGLVLFCLNIDARLLWGWEVARPLVPVGGSAFILAWVAFGAGVLRPER